MNCLPPVFYTVGLYIILLVHFLPTDVSCTCFTNDHTRHARTEVLSLHEVRQIELHLAHLFDLPAKRFKRRDRQKKIARSESKFLIEMYEKKHGIFQKESVKESWIEHKKTVRKSNYIVAVGANPASLQNGDNESGNRADIVLGFHWSGIPDSSRLVAAEMRLFKRQSSNDDVLHYDISTHMLQDNQSVFVRQDSWTSDDRGWMVIDLSDILANKTHDFVDIIVSAKVKNWEAKIVDDVKVSGLKSQIDERPFLVAYFEADLNLKVNDKLNTRGKCRIARSAREAMEPIFRSIPKSCTLQIFYVDFLKLDKFTSVIVPERYQANYCSGKCKFPLQGQVTNHAIVQSVYGLAKHDFEPLCAPKDMDAMDIIYFDSQDKIIHKTYKEMIVKSCICQ